MAYCMPLLNMKLIVLFMLIMLGKYTGICRNGAYNCNPIRPTKYISKLKSRGGFTVSVDQQFSTRVLKYPGVPRDPYKHVAGAYSANTTLAL